MKKFICGLVITMSLLLSTPISFASPCTDACWQTYDPCYNVYLAYCEIVYGPSAPLCLQIKAACDAGLNACLDECQ
jgi:hypothetical protein